MSWTTIRTGAKTRLDTISGVSTHARAPLTKADSVVATVIPQEPLVVPAGHRGKVEVRFAIRLTTQKATLEDSQDALDALTWPTGTGSVVAAMFGDRTLGGVVDDIEFVQVTGYEQIADGNAVQADVVFRALVTA